VTIVNDRFRHRDTRNNKSINAGFQEGLQPVLDFLYQCRRNYQQLVKVLAGSSSRWQP
jgi:hypothetical protein